MLRTPRPPYLQALRSKHLGGFLGAVEPAVIERLVRPQQWEAVAGGEALTAQGEPGDTMGLLVSGWLRSGITDDNGRRQRGVCELSRGQLVGEMSLYTDEPRSAPRCARAWPTACRCRSPACRC